VQAPFLLVAAIAPKLVAKGEGVSLDTGDAARIAEFWAAVLGLRVSNGANTDFASVATK
jgi:hypothetical protein